LLINYLEIFVILKQSPAAHWIRLSVGRRAVSRSAQNWLQANCPDFIIKDQWPPNLSNINPVDYHVWGAMLEAYHKLKAKNNCRTRGSASGYLG